MDDAVEKQWRAAQHFVAKGPSARLEYLVDDAKARLFAYRAQGLDGPCPDGQDGSLNSDAMLRKKQEAWKLLGDMSREEAKKLYVEFLTSLLPEWKEWDQIYGQALRENQQAEGGEAGKLLRAFSAKTGLQLRSRL